MEINFWGTVYGCKFFLPYLLKNEEGHIVNVLSEFALNGFPAKTAYCSSKAALLGFSNSLYTELYDTQVGLSIILPGAVDTNIVLKGKSQSLELAKQESRFLKKTGISPQKIALKIVSAIKRNKLRVPLGLMAYLMDYAVRFSPVLVHRAIGR